ncbi:MAG: response regulator [Deltaproteobacteria bacterium]|nr:response regulator [Deltaproteobacteria bacterium]
MARPTITMNQSFHILIVDDEDAIQRTVRGVLEDEGYRTSSVGDGNEAIGAIRQNKPDVVLLDIWLPGLDGIQLLCDIKKSNPDLEIIMISGHANVHTAVQAVKLGAFDFIEKPLSREHLLMTLARALEHRRLVRENRELRNRIMEAGNTPAPVFRTALPGVPADTGGPAVLPAARPQRAASADPQAQHGGVWAGAPLGDQGRTDPHPVAPRQRHPLRQHRHR